MSDTILNSKHFQEALVKCSRETGIPYDKVEKEAAADLKEMAARPGRFSVAGWEAFSRWLARAYKLDVDDRALDDLRKLNKASSLVFLPNHRSYLDPLILRSAMQPYGFPPNHVLGGVNLAIWPLADFGQKNGIVFIRREFKDDHVYRATLRAYLSYLIAERSNLEWYIEGGRTRTGKLRPPRYGILSYVIDAYTEHPDNDVHIVPTSIIYDQQHEVSAISAEEAGGVKSPESLKWFYQFSRSQSRRLGRAHVRFGEPLSLQEAVKLTEDEHGELRPRLAVPKVAFEVANRINAVTPITPVALVTFALLDNEDRSLTVGEGRDILGPLLNYIHKRDLPMTDDLDLSSHGEMRKALERLISENVVEMYDGGFEPVFRIPRQRQHEAAFYRNTVIHFFVNRAIVEVAVLKAMDEGGDAEAITEHTWEHARRLKDLLKFEFFFPSTRDFAKDVRYEVSLAFPGWEDTNLDVETVEQSFKDAKLHVAHRVVAPFLEAYTVLFKQLALLDPKMTVESDVLVKKCMDVAQQLWLQHLLHNPESISKDLFKNGLQLADNLGLLEPGDEDLRERRAAVAKELQSYVDKVSVIRHLARERSKEFLASHESYGV